MRFRLCIAVAAIGALFASSVSALEIEVVPVDANLLQRLDGNLIVAPAFAPDPSGDVYDFIHALGGPPGTFLQGTPGYLYTFDQLPSTNGFHDFTNQAQPVLNEVVTDLGGNQSQIDIVSVELGRFLGAPVGLDLFPAGASVGGVPLTDAVVFIGGFGSPFTLDFPDPVVVQSASILLDSAVLGPLTANLAPDIFFNAPNPWDGFLGIGIAGLTGFQVDAVQVSIVVQGPDLVPEPATTSMCVMGLAALLFGGRRRRRAA